MYSGYVQKRNKEIAPTMQKVFSVLWGTLLLDYESEEESKTSMCPKLVSEIVGVSEWDGYNRNPFPFGFLLVTHTGGTFYFSVATAKERSDWILNVRRALECAFANDAVKDYKPTKYIQDKPRISSSKQCAKTNQSLTQSNSVFCKSCGRGFSSPEFVQELSTMLQIRIEECEKVCLDCKTVQLCVVWMKCLNYSHLMTLHEMTPKVTDNLTTTFKSTFKWRRQHSSSLDSASKLFEEKSLTAEEFRDLQLLDQTARTDKLFEAAEQISNALEVIGNDMQMIISLLMKPMTAETGGRVSYHEIILKILKIADDEPDLIEFYLPQILQAHLIESGSRTPQGYYKVDLLQQALLVLAQKYPSLALRITWLLVAIVSDYYEKKVSQVQYAASMSMLLQLEMAVTGLVSSIADVTTCQTLFNLIHPASHQKQELGVELSGLFLIRRRLQEVFDEEGKNRKARLNFALIGSSRSSTIGSSSTTDESVSSSFHSTSNSGLEVKQIQEPQTSQVRSVNDHLSQFSNPKSCVELLRHLGVGQASSNISSTTSKSEFDHVDDSSHHSKTSRTSEDDSNHFNRQLDFVDKISTFVDSLRNVDRALRTDVFRAEMNRMNENSHELGWDPCAGAGEPGYRIVRILADDCRVFKTKARAPSMIVCEVVREDLDNPDYISRSRYGRFHRSVDQRSLSNSALIAPPIFQSSPSSPNRKVLSNQTILKSDHHNNSYSNSGVNNNSEEDALSLSISAAKRMLSADSTNEERSKEAGIGDVEGIIASNISKAIADIHKAQSTQHNNESDLANFKSEVNNNDAAGLQFPPPLSPSNISNVSNSDSTKENLLLTPERIPQSEISPKDQVSPVQTLSEYMARNSNDLSVSSSSQRRSEKSIGSNDSVLNSFSTKTKPRAASLREPVVPLPQTRTNRPQSFGGSHTNPLKDLMRSPPPAHRSTSPKHAGEGMEAIDSIYDFGEMILTAPAKLISRRVASSNSLTSLTSHNSSIGSNDGKDGEKRSRSDASNNSSLHRSEYNSSRMSLNYIMSAGKSMTSSNSSNHSANTQPHSNSNSVSSVASTSTSTSSFFDSKSKSSLNFPANIYPNRAVKSERLHLSISESFLSKTPLSPSVEEETSSEASPAPSNMNSSKNDLFLSYSQSKSQTGSLSLSQPHSPSHSNPGPHSPTHAVPRRRKSTSLLPVNKKSTNLLTMLMPHTNSTPSNMDALSVAPSSSVSDAITGITGAPTKSSIIYSLNNKSKDKEDDEVEEFDVCDEEPEVRKVRESARRMLRDGTIDKAEYDLLVKSDNKFRNENARDESKITQSKVESSFGEQWSVKRERILGSRCEPLENENGDRFWPAWDLRSFIVKSNDDLRQEVCCLQMMKLCKEIFDDFGLSKQLWLKPYKIVSTSSNSGMVQVLTDTMSIDALKKTNGFTTLLNHFKNTYGSSGPRLKEARKKFAASLAAYSLFSYILFIKDRHNGNIMIDTEGHIIHIDFGFMLSIAPGGYLSLETAPFKLTEEMVDVLGGLESKMFGEFVKAFTAGFLALRVNADSLVTNLQVLSILSPYPCFAGKDVPSIIEKFKSRFRTDLSVNDAVHHCLDLIIASYGHYGTKQYDSFQYYTNGILP